MIVRIKNLFHPTHLASRSNSPKSPFALTTKKAFQRRQSVLCILPESPQRGQQEDFFTDENSESSGNKFVDFYPRNATKRRLHRIYKVHGDPMRSGSADGVFPLIAAKVSSSFTTVSSACCWSVWVLLLLSVARKAQHGRTIGNFHRWRNGFLPSLATAAIAPTSMSGYSMLFADAFHPSASYSSQDQEEDTSNSDDASKPSTASKDESTSIPEDTCDANKVSAGKPHPNDNRLLLFHFDSTPSTQDEAKAIAKNLSAVDSPPDTFCVTATSQLKGRGTTGRQWLGAPGNVFVTIGIPVDVWMTKMMKERKIPLTLLPLKIGELTASLVQKELESCGASGRVTVKWPNDVLVDDKKISGTLIENDSNWFLIGIGINVAHAPTVPTTGANYGRPSVSLDDYCDSGEAEERNQKARDMGVELALNFHRWIYEEDSDTGEIIVEGWKRWLNWDTELTMRNDANRDAPRRVVKLVDVLSDGRVKVVDKKNGKEEILVSDYFV